MTIQSFDAEINL